MLYLDFVYRGERCREQTQLLDTPANRKAVSELAERLRDEIQAGSFDYAKVFPRSRRAKRLAIAPPSSVVGASITLTPSFSEYALYWLQEESSAWALDYRQEVQRIIEVHLCPAFGKCALHAITVADVKAFRERLAAGPGRKGATRSPARVNKIMNPLRQILCRAAREYGFAPAFRDIRPLRQPRPEIQPFALQDVVDIIAAVPPAYRDYLTVRFFSGMRRGEIAALAWSDLDMDQGLIRVRARLSNGEGTVATPHARDLAMVPVVRAALEKRLLDADPGVPWVFTNRKGNPIESCNFTNRIWHPTLQKLGLAKRSPGQIRHTAAALMLQAGESLDWIAGALGIKDPRAVARTYADVLPPPRPPGAAYEAMVQAGIVAATQVHEMGLAAESFRQQRQAHEEEVMQGLAEEALEREAHERAHAQAESRQHAVVLSSAPKERTNRSTWTQAQLEELCATEGKPAQMANLAARQGRTERSVRERYKRLQREGMRPRTNARGPLLRWTSEDLEWLRANYAPATAEELAARFPHRTMSAIRIKASEMGLALPRPQAQSLAIARMKAGSAGPRARLDTEEEEE